VQSAVPREVRELAVTRTEIFSGPMPSPAACKGYEEILPGFTDRALVLAEKAQNADIADRRRSDIFELCWKLVSLFVAALSVFGIFGGGIYLIVKGHDIGGYGMLAGGVALVAGALLSGKSARK